MREQQYSVYIMTSFSGVLYVGVTNDLERRVNEHKARLIPSFTQRYNCTRLVWFEQYNDITLAIAREKQLKNWRREWKLVLIREENPDFDDLAERWLE
jgi:putative endonuclease